MRALGRTLLLAASLAASSALRLGAQRPLGRRAAFAGLGAVAKTLRPAALAAAEADAKGHSYPCPPLSGRRSE